MPEYPENRCAAVREPRGVCRRIKAAGTALLFAGLLGACGAPPNAASTSQTASSSPTMEQTPAASTPSPTVAEMPTTVAMTETAASTASLTATTATMSPMTATSETTATAPSMETTASSATTPSMEATGAAISTATGADATEAARPNATGSGVSDNIMLADIVGNPDAYLGQTVTVEGRVKRFLTVSGFLLSQDGIVSDRVDDELLVVGTLEQDPGIIVPDLRVIVSGVVRRFNLAEAEKALNRDFEDRLFAQYAGRPAIFATMIQENPGATSTPSAEATSSATATNVTLADIVGHLTGYIGKQVTLRAEAQQWISPNGFVIGDPGASAGGSPTRVLVVSARQATSYTKEQLEGKRVMVQGTARMFDLQSFEKEALGYDLQDDRFKEWVGRPVVVATTVDVAP